MSDKKMVSDRGTYYEKKVNISDTVRLTENMTSISSILFTDVTAIITKKTLENSILTVAGSCNAELIYLSDFGNADRISFSIPFDITESAECEKGLFLGECDVTSCEITPIKGRRCDINIGLVVSGHIFPQSVVLSVEQNYPYRVFKDSSERQISSVSSVPFTQSYEYSHPSGIGEGIKIVYSGADVFDITTNSSPAGILVNGFIRQNIIYSTTNDDETCNYYVITENTAFSRFVDTGYDVRYDDYAVNCIPSHIDTYIKRTDAEECICMDVSICGEITLFCTQKSEYISDIFSPEMDLNCNIIDRVCCKISKIAQKEVKFRGETNLYGEYMSCKMIPASETINGLITNDGNVVNISVSLSAGCILLSAGASDVSNISFLMNEKFSVEKQSTVEGRYFAVYNINEVIPSTGGAKAYMTCTVTVDVYEICDVIVNEVSEMSFSEYPASQSDMATVRIFYEEDDTGIFSVAKMTKKSPEEIIRKKSESGDNSPIIVWG